MTNGFPVKPTIDEAKAYVEAYFVKDGRAIEILAAQYNDEYGDMVVDVRFVINDEARVIGEPGYIMSVWYEPGVNGPYLYGEW